MTRKASFPPVARADARLLVLGSLPGERSLADGRYYAHPQNQFWRLMSPVVGRDLPALGYDDRLATLVEARVALWDVIASARRAGSTDAAIREVEANDLAALVAKLPALRAVAFNGATAAAVGGSRLGATGLDLVPLPSSSPLHTIGVAAKLPAWSALAAFLTG
ncbi:DNA-deoxyinosine glycosylase [uncultured Sphingomonas sp.]|uniref:DNA-deoxyinosine glycosylase n=1 Tax=uncultured Sphingomonas sp. TaxID=158754 RepID=UPI0035CB6E1D